MNDPTTMIQDQEAALQLRYSEGIALAGQTLAEQYLAEHDGDAWTPVNIAEGSAAFANAFLSQLIFGTLAFGVQNWERGYDVLDQTSDALFDGIENGNDLSDIYFDTSVAFGTTYGQGVSGLVYDDVLCGLGHLGAELLTLKYRVAAEIQDGSFFEQSPARAMNEVFGPLVAGNLVWYGAEGLIRAGFPAGAVAETEASTALAQAQPAVAVARYAAGARAIPLSEGVEVIVPPMVPPATRAFFEHPVPEAPSVIEQTGRGLWREVQQPMVAVREMSAADIAVQELLAPELETYPLVLRRPPIEVDALPVEVARVQLRLVAPRSVGLVESTADTVAADWAWGMSTADTALGNALAWFVQALRGGRGSLDLGGILGTVVTGRPPTANQEGEQYMSTGGSREGGPHTSKVFAPVINMSSAQPPNHRNIEGLLSILSRNNINAQFVSNRADVLEKVLALVSPDNIVAFAGSETVREAGVRDYFLNHGSEYHVIDPYEPGITAAESYERRRNSLLADVLLTGSNAITLDGQIVNMDNQGNRVAGISFGPRRVIIVVGENKIVTNLAEARRRIAQVAAPLNNQRLQKGNPCEASGRCVSCGLPTRICRIYSVIDGQTAKDRLHVIIVGEKLGF